ncbi:MAG TPA: hypothetical protein VJ967_10815 [Clostridia bacterium]|nr:hypothetical protein [Clostridia bacterium]
MTETQIVEQTTAMECILICFILITKLHQAYPYNEDEDANTFSDWSYAFGPNSYQEEFTSGTIDITVSGDTFSITGSGTVENGDTVQFDYEGPVTEEFSAGS